MVVHTCERCNKEFNKKSNYLEHINRKFICKIINKKTNNIIEHPKIPPINIETNNSCPYCGVVLSRKDHLKRHIEITCKIKKLQEKENNLENKNEKIVNLEKDIINLKDIKNIFTFFCYPDQHFERGIFNVRQNQGCLIGGARRARIFGSRTRTFCSVPEYFVPCTNKMFFFVHFIEKKIIFLFLRTLNYLLSASNLFISIVTETQVRICKFYSVIQSFIYVRHTYRISRS
jgi:uncharacterized C2H2 Zn-finger protein